MSKKQNLYTGSAGQAAVMSEFLIRGYNVAVPEVDVGDDLFVVEDAEGSFVRVQVKTATGKALKKTGYTAFFSVPLVQLETPIQPVLYYVLAVRHTRRWSDFMVIERGRLLDEHAAYGVGSLGGKRKQLVNLRFSFRDDDVRCGGRSFQACRNDFGAWPAIAH